jgi:hypothetical protein
MCHATDNPACCEICAVIRVLHVNNTSPAESHRELCAVYGQNVTSEGTARQWCKMFVDGEQKFTMKSEVMGHVQ